MLIGKGRITYEKHSLCNQRDFMYPYGSDKRLLWNCVHVYE